MSIIVEIYTFIQEVAKGLNTDVETRHDLIQEVIIQIMKKDIEQLETLKQNGELNAYCCGIMYTNFSSDYSPFNYHQRKYKKLVPYSVDIRNFKEYYKTSKQLTNKDEYNEQQRVISYMRKSNSFNAIDVNIMICYFDTQYNASEAWRLVKDAGVKCSWGWWQMRLKDIKNRIPNTFKERWKGY